MPQVVCTVNPEAPACDHDRFCEFWGDHDDGVVLGSDLALDEWWRLPESAVREWITRVWRYNSVYNDVHVRPRDFASGQEGPLNECEKSHRQRVALDLVFLVSIAKDRNFKSVL